MAKQKRNFANEFAELVEKRKHKILEGIYINGKSILRIQCLKHEKTHEVIAKNYKEAQFGIPCCSVEQQMSKKTRDKIGEGHRGKPKKYTVWLKG